MGKVSKRGPTREKKKPPPPQAYELPPTRIFLNKQCPPAVEGRSTTLEELAMKSTNGQRYYENIGRIMREFPSEMRYNVKTDLCSLENRLKEPLKTHGYSFLDASDILNGIRHSLHLVTAWALLVHHARTTDTLVFLRRTQKNCASMLMLQRQEHLRDNCDEKTPISFMCLIRDTQFCVTRENVPDQGSTERMLLDFASKREDCSICGKFLRQRQVVTFPCRHSFHLDCCSKQLGFTGSMSRETLLSRGCPTCGRTGTGDFAKRSQKNVNMPKALFRQQLNSIDCVLKDQGIPPPPYETMLDGRVKLRVVPALGGNRPVFLDVCIVTRFFEIPI